jgi:hypothetical protein
MNLGRVGPLLRAARAAVLAALCAALTAAGHVWMSGRGLPWWALALAFAAVGAAGYALAGRQRGLPTICGLMLAGEWGLHLLFTAAQGPAPISPMQRAVDAATAALPASARGLPVSDWVCGGMDGAGMGGAGSGTSARLAAALMAGHGLGMLAAHAAAGLLCAWWLWRGESALFRLLRWLGTFRAPLLAILWPDALVAPDLVTGRRVRVRPDAFAATLRLLATRVLRRGPPCPRLSM